MAWRWESPTIPSGKFRLGLNAPLPINECATAFAQRKMNERTHRTVSTRGRKCAIERFDSAWETVPAQSLRPDDSAYPRQTSGSVSKNSPRSLAGLVAFYAQKGRHSHVPALLAMQDASLLFEDDFRSIAIGLLLLGRRAKTCRRSAVGHQLHSR